MSISTDYYVRMIHRYLLLNNVFENKSNVKIYLEASDYRSSILSLIECLYYCGIECNVVKTYYSVFQETDRPVILQFNNDEGDYFVIAHYHSNNEVRVHNFLTNRVEKVRKDDFLKMWTGIMILPVHLSEKNDRNTLKQMALRYKPQLITLFSVLFLLLVAFISINICLILLGLFVSIYLIYNSHAFTQSSRFDALCKRGTKIDCHKVQNSKFSKIAGLSLSEIAFMYFFSMLFILLLILSLPFFFLGFVYSALSLMSIIVVFISILSQWLFVKKWCLYCLAISSIIITNTALSLVYFLRITFPYQFGDILVSLLLSAISFVVSVAMLNFLKQRFTTMKELWQEKFALRRLIQHDKVTSLLFNSLDQCDESELRELLIGEKDARLSITTLISPQCSKCKEVVLFLIRLMHKHPKSFCWNIRIDGSLTNEITNQNINQLRIYSILRKNDSQESLKALYDWAYGLFGDGNYSDTDWKLYQKHLFLNSSIKATTVPTIWISGKKIEVSELYHIEPYLFKNFIGAL